MSAMLNQLNPTTVLSKFQDIAQAGTQIVSTDTRRAKLSTFLTLARQAKSQKIRSVAFVPPLVVTANPDFDLIRAKVASAIAASAAGPTATPTATPTARAAAKPSATKAPTAKGHTKVISKTRPADWGSAGNPAPETDDLSAVCSAD